MRARYELASVLRTHWPEVERHPQINSWQLRCLGALMRCRTAAMGGHLDACSSCGTTRISYNSCRNRHCPKCQGKNREHWIQKREAELLPVPYFHVVFTLPSELNQLAMHRPREVYSCLFETAWESLQTFGRDPKHLGAQTGMIAILHTWGQQLTLHPHLHCIVPGGGLSKNGKWKTAKTKGKYLFPVKALSPVFRAKYVERLKDKLPDLDRQLVNALFRKNWVVYAKRPFGHPKAVLEYLGRYTHKVAISNHRIKSIENGQVSFSYKDYRKAGKNLEMNLEALEFIRRFSQHILPKGFVRIRHYGILSSTAKKSSIPKISLQLKQKPQQAQEPRKLESYNPKICPCCKTETMVTIEIIPRRGPPKKTKSLMKNLD